jgi:hypothetical protein
MFGGHMNTVTVHAATKALGGRGRFAIVAGLSDAPKARRITGLDATITRMQRAGQPIPIRGFAATVKRDGAPIIGTLNPHTLQRVMGSDIYAQGELHLELAEASGLLRRIKAVRRRLHRRHAERGVPHPQSRHR